MIRLEQDRSNYGVFVWKGLDGYDKLCNSAHLFKKQAKMQSGKALKKDKHSTNFRMKQAQIISHGFLSMIKRRKREFNETLQNAINKRDFSTFNVRRSSDGHILYTPPTGAQFLPSGRFTQPEETAFMFLRIIDQIHIWEDQNYSHVQEPSHHATSAKKGDRENPDLDWPSSEQRGSKVPSKMTIASHDR